MFGLNDNTTQSNDDPAMLDNVKQLASAPADSIVPPQPGSTTAITTAAATPLQQQLDASDSQTPAPAQPLQGFTMDAPTAAPSAEPASSAPSLPDIQSFSAPAASSSSSATDATAALPVASDQTDSSSILADDTIPENVSAPDIDHLASLKQDALSHLEPLTDHIDGSAEEVFKTTMMMIQANDNHTLLEKALEAAKKITDDKERAQAMLDIINEINYFAQK